MNERALLHPILEALFRSSHNESVGIELHDENKQIVRISAATSMYNLVSGAQPEATTQPVREEM